MENNNKFVQLSAETMSYFDGGGLVSAGAAFFGGVAVAATPFISLYFGVGVGATAFSFGCGLLDAACENVDK